MKHLPVKVVSLANSTERRRTFSARAATISLEFEFWDAVDAGSPAFKSLSCDDVRIRHNHGRPMAKAEIACAASHRAIYRWIVAGNHLGCLVMEDDARTDPSIHESISYLNRNAGKLASQNMVICFGKTHHPTHRLMALSRRSAIPIDGRISFRKVIRSEHAIQGTFGYYISREAAAAILAAEASISMVADAWDTRLRNGTLGSIWLACPEQVHHPVDGDSLIQPQEQHVLRTGTFGKIGRFLRFSALRWLVYPFLRCL